MSDFHDIYGYAGLYKISPDGQVLNVQTGNLLKGNINSHGYMVFSLTKGGQKKDCKLHRLLAQTFIPNPNNYECINHKDGNKLNNSLVNLEWCTKGYNNFHARTVLNASADEKPVCQTTMNGEFVALWASIGKAAKTMRVSPPCIADCCEGRAKSAAGFVWEYAAKLPNDFLAEVKRLSTIRKISELQAEISKLQAQL